MESPNLPIPCDANGCDVSDSNSICNQDGVMCVILDNETQSTDPLVQTVLDRQHPLYSWAVRRHGPHIYVGLMQSFLVGADVLAWKESKWQFHWREFEDEGVSPNVYISDFTFHPDGRFVVADGTPNGGDLRISLSGDSGNEPLCEQSASKEDPDFNEGVMCENTSFYGVRSVAYDSSGRLWLLNGYTNRVLRMDTDFRVWTAAGPTYEQVETMMDGRAGGINKWTQGFAGDGESALTARFAFLEGYGQFLHSRIKVGSDDSVYVTDTLNHRIRKIKPDGTIMTIAGKGVQPDDVPESAGRGDGGAATDAYLDRPIDVALDSKGNIYIAEMFQLCVRRVDSNGRISTVAGVCGQVSDSPAKSGVATETPLNCCQWISTIEVNDDGNLYIACGGSKPYLSGRIYRVRLPDASQ